MIQRILLCIALLVLLGSYAAFGQSPDSMPGVSKADILDEALRLKARVTSLQYQQGKYDIYIQRVRQSIADLEFTKTESLRIAELLEPYLEETVSRLEESVGRGLPFLMEDREKRLSFVKNQLGDARVARSEKLRKVLEALNVEALYGTQLTSTDAVINLAGNDTEVTLFRLGRVALYYLSLDESQVGWWNDATRRWESLSDSYTRSVRRAIDIAQRKRTVEIVTLPIGVPQ